MLPFKKKGMIGHISLKILLYNIFIKYTFYSQEDALNVHKNYNFAIYCVLVYVTEMMAILMKAGPLLARMPQVAGLSLKKFALSRQVKE